MEYSHEIVMPNDDIPFKMFIFEGRDGNYMREKHWHRSIEIFALFEGELEFYVNEVRYPLQPGEFMLVNSNEIHSINSPKKNLTVVLQIPLSTFEKYYTDEKFIYFSHSSRLQDEEVMKVIKSMYEIYAKKEFGYELQVQSLFFTLIYLLVAKYRKTDVDAEMIKSNKKLMRLSSITDYMKKNYNKDLSLESLAQTFGYSPTYLSRMFQKYAKMNYKSYLDNLRLEHAYKDLMNTELSISTIASQNGFPNSKAFSKVFQKKYKELPSKFRKAKLGT
ncbi:MAG TPA: AraC family transcriptional regulator [Candidatus Dorea gallistercoris]|uniref:AraC family transcriptional regulator n=1 Tax=Candidatus Dorea gallistercoris TaxID=2838542 RepID=A0A9D1UD40_9FIRM|nr:AraC family transcriptional regulator [Candidatus Dorea gallistercoris]